MDTVSLVRASAEIVQITKLKKGDVYKRLDDNAYSSSKLKYGVVYDILFNGSEAVIQAVEYDKSYNDIKTSLEVFATDKELKLFSCTPDEVREYLGNVEAGAEQTVTTKEKDLKEAQDTLERIHSIVSGELARKLTAPESVTTPQLASESR